MKQTWKHNYMKSFFFYVLLISQNPVVVMALLPKRTFFRSTIMKGWHRLWARWSQDSLGRQFSGFHILVQCLEMMSSFMPTVTATQRQEHVWVITTLFHLQCRTTTQSWPGLCSSHLMRWRYFISTHPAKCKITQTILFITIKSESEAMHLI